MNHVDRIYPLGFTAFFALPLIAYLALFAAGRVSLPAAKRRALAAESSVHSSLGTTTG